MYLFNSLDKANLGNAKTAGMEKDLGFAGTNKWYGFTSPTSQARGYMLTRCVIQ
jgi:hypothetical protein